MSFRNYDEWLTPAHEHRRDRVLPGSGRGQPHRGLRLALAVGTILTGLCLVVGLVTAVVAAGESRAPGVAPASAAPPRPGGCSAAGPIGPPAVPGPGAGHPRGQPAAPRDPDPRQLRRDRRPHQRVVQGPGTWYLGAQLVISRLPRWPAGGVHGRRDQDRCRHRPPGDQVGWKRSRNYLVPRRSGMAFACCRRPLLRAAQGRGPGPGPGTGPGAGRPGSVEDR